MRREPTCFRLDLVENLMVCEVNEPRGVDLALENLGCPFRMLPFTNKFSPKDHIQFQAYVLPEPTESMVAENGLGAELLSGSGVVSAWNEDRHPCFV